MKLEFGKDTEPAQDRVIEQVGDGELTVEGDFRTSDADRASEGCTGCRPASCRTLTHEIVSTPKTAKGRRNVKLTAKAVEAIKEHRERQLQEREALLGLWQDHTLVFPTRVGTPVSRHNLVNRSFKPLLKRAGLPDIRFHELSHTCATLMLAVGTNPKVVQETLGHANVSVTPDIYSHLLPNMQDEVAEKINELRS